MIGKERQDIEMTELASIKELAKFFNTKALRTAMKNGDELQAVLGGFRFGVAICTATEPDEPRYYHIECERLKDNLLCPFRPNLICRGDELYLKKCFVNCAKAEFGDKYK